MISKEIYRTIVTELADDFKKQGYQRVKGAFPSWTKPINGKFVTVWFQVARRGGQFTIEFQYSLKPEPGTAKWTEKRKRFFELLNDTERRHIAHQFPKGGLSANNDYWFLASSTEMVLAVARWLKPKIDLFMTRIVAETNDIE